MANNWRRLIWGYLLLVYLTVCCWAQVNIIGIPHSDRAVDLTVRDGEGVEVDTRKPLGPLLPNSVLILYCETKHPAISHLAWSRDGVEFFGSVSRFSDGMLQNELHITLGPAEKNAEYKCRGLNLRYDSIVEKTVRLSIEDVRPRIPFTARISPSNGTFKLGDTASLACLVQGARGPAIITWWKGEKLLNGTAVSAAPSIIIRDGITSTESTLTFKPALNDTTLPIFCRAISALSQLTDNITAEDSVKLDIIYLPVSQIVKNETISSKENGPVNIACSMKANPPVDKVRWYRNEKLIYEDRMKSPANLIATENSSNALNTGTKSDLQTNALKILQVSKSDVGAYACEGHNAVGWGSKSNAIDVRIQVKAATARSAKQQSSTVIHAAEGEKLTLTCTVADPSSPPAMTFIWRKDGVFLSRGHTYTINPVQDRHFGAYTCAPYNGAGEGDAAAITLTKKEATVQSSETTILMVASILGVVGGTVLLAILIWCLCLSKACKKRNKHSHLTSKFISGTYPIHTLPRPHLIANQPNSTSTLSRADHLNAPARSSSLQKLHQQPQLTPTALTNAHSAAAVYGVSRPNYYPSWYSQKTERSNLYTGRNFY